MNVRLWTQLLSILLAGMVLAAGCRNATPIATPESPSTGTLRILVNSSSDENEPDILITGADGATVQYWISADQTVTQSLYSSADGSVRIDYNQETGSPETILDEDTGDFISIREDIVPGRTDFWFFDQSRRISVRLRRF